MRSVPIGLLLVSLFSACGEAPPPTTDAGVDPTDVAARRARPLRPEIRIEAEDRSRMHVAFDDVTALRVAETSVEALAERVELRVRRDAEPTQAAGLELLRVDDDSVLAAIDLRVGDVLLQVGDKPVTSRDDLLALFRALKEGPQEIQVHVERRGRRVRYTIDARDPPLRKIARPPR